jgi:hypothetical protein
MPLQLPNLDDRRYADLVEEARSLIPTYAPEWTNHNPSDPGIMLIELFAYLSEMLAYRLNRVTDDNQRQFLKLLNGPDWRQQHDLREEVRQAVLAIRQRHRAVTCADFEVLSTENFNRFLSEMKLKERNGEPLEEWWQATGLNDKLEAHLPSKILPLARARCLEHKYLDAGSEAARQQLEPGHISVIIVPSALGETAENLQPTQVQRQALWGYLDKRRMVATRHHVVGPIYAPVSAEILVARRLDVPTENLRNRMAENIEAFLHRLSGGPQATGWPFGREVYASELYESLEKVEGVDYLPDLMLFSECKPEDQRCVAAEPVWHDDGGFIGLHLAEHHLPAARIDPSRLVIVPHARFIRVQLLIRAKAKPSADPKVLKQQIRSTVRKFFHPLHKGPKPDAVEETELKIRELEKDVKAVAGVLEVTAIDIKTAPDRIARDVDGNIKVSIQAGEVIDWKLRAEVERET